MSYNPNADNSEEMRTKMDDKIKEWKRGLDLFFDNYDGYVSVPVAVRHSKIKEAVQEIKKDLEKNVEFLNIIIDEFYAFIRNPKFYDGSNIILNEGWNALEKHFEPYKSTRYEIKKICINSDLKEKLVKVLEKFENLIVFMKYEANKRPAPFITRATD